MTLGAAFAGTGYLSLAFAPTMFAALAAYALLVGPGIAMFGNFASSLLAGGWFPASRGRAVGLANVSLFVALMPLVGQPLIAHHGLRAFYLFLRC